MVALRNDENDELHEVSRVAFLRRYAKDPAIPFDDALQNEIDKARAAAYALNQAEKRAEEARAAKLLEARDKIRGILGEPEEAMV